MYEEKRVECVRILKEEYGRYETKLKEELAKLPKGSKKWWKLNRQLLNKKKQTSSIPPLKYEGEWLHEAKDKADLSRGPFPRKPSCQMTPRIVLFLAYQFTNLKNSLSYDRITPKNF